MATLRIQLNDKAIARLPAPDEGRYVVRDTELKGFFLLVGPKKRTFMIQGDLREKGRRAATVRLAIGHNSEMTTRTARAVAKGQLAQISLGQHPNSDGHVAKASDHVGQGLDYPKNGKPAGITLRGAWERYRLSMERKNRSARTIESYRDHVERIFRDWLDAPLIQLGQEPTQVVTMHDLVTSKNGPYIANGSMRTLRAIYNHARKSNRELPHGNPVDSVDWNREKRRDTGMGVSDLKDWFIALAKIGNPIRREFHLFSLLSASRPAALKEARPSHLDLRRRVLHMPRPKGGADRAFDIPLSRQMVLCLIRSMRFGRQMHHLNAGEWLFPADSTEGHMIVQKEDRAVLSRWGNDLRQTYRTVAAHAGLSELDARLLMNHSAPGVNAGYITRQKLLENHLRAQQQTVSNVMFATLNASLAEIPELREWIGGGAGCRHIV